MLYIIVSKLKLGMKSNSELWKYLFLSILVCRKYAYELFGGTVI